MKQRRRHIEVDSLAPVITQIYNKYRFKFGIHSHDAEEICGQAIVNLVKKLREEEVDPREFIERMGSRELTSVELKRVYSVHQNECRNYTRGSTYYRHRKHETVNSPEAGRFDLNHELQEALWITLDRIAADYGKPSDEYDIAEWMVFRNDNDAIPEAMQRLSEKEWKSKKSQVVGFLRQHLTDLGHAPAASSERSK